MYIPSNVRLKFKVIFALAHYHQVNQHTQLINSEISQYVTYTMTNANGVLSCRCC
jgi:hypothetical protein